MQHEGAFGVSGGSARVANQGHIVLLRRFDYRRTGFAQFDHVGEEEEGETHILSASLQFHDLRRKGRRISRRRRDEEDVKAGEKKREGERETRRM